MAEEKKKPVKDTPKESSEPKKRTPPKKEETPPESGLKRLYRSRMNRMVGGVCGGIAEYFGIDPTIVRILFVVAIFAGGLGFFAYIIAWIIIPESKKESGEVPTPSKTPVAGIIIGAALVLIGLAMLFNWIIVFLSPYMFLPFFPFKSFFAILLIASGIFFIVYVVRKNGEKEISHPKITTGQRSLYRSRINKKLSGVCGGIGEYFNIDPTIIRIAWAFFTIATIFPGIIMYIVMWFIVPEAPTVQEKSS